MEIIMRKWYAFLSGKKMLGIGLGAVVALTALLAVNFYREQNDRYVTTNGSTDELTQAEQASKTQSDGMPSEANQDSIQNTEQAASDEVAEVAGQTSLVSMILNFDSSKKLQWPVAGRELIKSFSMDGLVYYPTLEEYKVCPAIMVQAKPGDAVLAPADGVISKIAANEEIGTYLCVTLGDEYQAIIGNMDNVSVAEGDYVLKGTVLGGLAEPTKYYVTEGPNLYFELQKNGEPVDPLDYLE